MTVNELFRWIADMELPLKDKGGESFRIVIGDAPFEDGMEQAYFSVFIMLPEDQRGIRAELILFEDRAIWTRLAPSAAVGENVRRNLSIEGAIKLIILLIAGEIPLTVERPFFSKAGMDVIPWGL